MTQKIRISLLAKHEIAMDGLRNVFAGDYFHVEAAVSGGAALLGRLERADVDAGSHVIVIDGGDRSFGVDAAVLRRTELMRGSHCCWTIIYSRISSRRFRPASTPSS